jgi:hypothetical protein
VALSVDRSHVHQKPARRAALWALSVLNSSTGRIHPGEPGPSPKRIDRCHSGCPGQCRRQARSSRACHRRIRSVRRAIGAASPIALSASPFWKDFLRSLTRRGLRGVKLVRRKIDPGSITSPPHCRRSQEPARGRNESAEHQPAKMPGALDAQPPRPGRQDPPRHRRRAG